VFELFLTFQPKGNFPPNICGRANGTALLAAGCGAGGLRRHDPDQTYPLDCHQKWRMPFDFDPRRYSTIELVAIAISVVAVAVLALIGFSILAEP
jgi:hypothetical protein